MPDKPNKTPAKVKRTRGSSATGRARPGEALLKQYDLKNGTDVLRLLERFQYNAKWCSEAVGKNPQWMAAMLKRMGLQEEVKQRKKDWRGRVAVPGKSRKLDAEATKMRREEELMERAANNRLKTKQFLNRCSQVEIENAIVNAGGCISDAAKILDVEYHILLRLVNSTPEFSDARERGEEEFHLEAKDMVLQCVRGARNPTQEQSKWLMFYAKSRLGMADQVTHRILEDSTPVPTGEPQKIHRPQLVTLDKAKKSG